LKFFRPTITGGRSNEDEGKERDESVGMETGEGKKGK